FPFLFAQAIGRQKYAGESAEAQRQEAQRIKEPTSNSRRAGLRRCREEQRQAHYCRAGNGEDQPCPIRDRAPGGHAQFAVNDGKKCHSTGPKARNLARHETVFAEVWGWTCSHSFSASSQDGFDRNQRPLIHFTSRW